MNEGDLSCHIAFGDTFDLPFSDLIHRFVPPDRSLGSPETSRLSSTQPGLSNDNGNVSNPCGVASSCGILSGAYQILVKKSFPWYFLRYEEGCVATGFLYAIDSVKFLSLRAF